MELVPRHDWDVPISRARDIQRELAGEVQIRPLPSALGLVAGADVAFDRAGGRAYGVVLVFSTLGMELVEQASAQAPLRFPYVPGLLTFREGPVLLEAFAQLKRPPDAVLFDGQGRAHPARVGLASHMGLWLGTPTVGCAKSCLVGAYDAVGTRRGDWAPLTDRDEQVGIVLRTRDRIRPVFVSPGHLADLDSSRELVLRCCQRYRLPEPTRQAHIAVSWLKAEAMS